MATFVDRKYGPYGAIVSSRSYKNGVLHGENDEPAVIIYDPDTGIETRKWFKEGKPWRDDFCAEVEILEHGKIRTRKWVMQRNNPDLPIQINYHYNGNIKDLFYDFSNIVMTKLPYSIHFYQNGKVRKKVWLSSRNPHNLLLTAYEEYYDNGEIMVLNNQDCTKYFFPDGKLYKLVFDPVKGHDVKTYRKVIFDTRGNPIHVIEYDKDGKLIDTVFPE